MKYKVYYVDKKGRMTDCVCDSLQECRDIAKTYGCDVDIYQYDKMNDSYKYFATMEIL